jgi:integrase
MNGTRDIVLKRCGCTDKHTRRHLAGHCPHLADPEHGRWYYAVQVTTVGGRKARYRRGGFATRDAAAAARRAILDAPADEAAAGAATVDRVRATLRSALNAAVREGLIAALVGVENDRLAPLWWLIALRGLRRGEAAALDRDDLDSEACELTISRQLIALPGELYCGPPKSRASFRTIALDEDGTRRLADQAVKQAIELLR